MTVKIHDIVMHYPGAAAPALDHVSLEIRENEFFTLLGPSGCGKTTLLRLIAGFEQPSAGGLLLDGQSLVGRMPYERPVNTVFQNYALFPHMTVAQNVGFGLEMQGRKAAEIAPIVQRMLELVRLHDFAQRRPAQLSGGQQQRVALARALATSPRLLLLDESLSALDLQLRREMQIELKRLQRETGITFVFVTHDQEEALTMSDRIAVMRSGTVQQIGTPIEIYERPVNRYVAGFIGEMNLLQPLAAGACLDFGEAGAWPCPSEGAPKPWVAVRPERLHVLTEAPPNTEPCLRGKLEDIIYQGNDTSYRVQMPGQAILRVRAQNRSVAQHDLQIGQTVWLRVEPASLRWIAD